MPNKGVINVRCHYVKQGTVDAYDMKIRDFFNCNFRASLTNIRGSFQGLHAYKKWGHVSGTNYCFLPALPK